jgi:hypothetical protein
MAEVGLQAKILFLSSPELHIGSGAHLAFYRMGNSDFYSKVKTVNNFYGFSSLPFLLHATPITLLLI